MNSLWTAYSFFTRFRVQWGNNEPGRSASSGSKIKMYLLTIGSTFCAVGVAFYVRFLVALFRDQKARFVGFRQSVTFDLGNRATTPREITTTIARIDVGQLRKVVFDVYPGSRT
jgi:hypothetical protein